MPLYAVIAEKDNPELGAKIASQFPTDYIEVTPAQWLLSADMIPNQLGDQLGVRTGALGRVLILEVTGSGSGWHSTRIWQWLRLKSAKTT